MWEGELTAKTLSSVSSSSSIEERSPLLEGGVAGGVGEGGVTKRSINWEKYLVQRSHDPHMTSHDLAT